MKKDKDLLFVLGGVGCLLFLFIGGIGLLAVLIFASFDSEEKEPELVNSAPAKPVQVVKQPVPKKPVPPPKPKPTPGDETKVEDKKTELQKMTDDALESIAKANALLGERDYAGGIQAFDDTMRKYYRIPYKVRSRVLTQKLNGMGHRDWGMDQVKRFDGILKKHANTLVAEYQQGIPDEKGAQAFLAAVRNRSALRKEWTALQKTVDQTLMELARKQLRVAFSGNYKTYEKPIENALRKRWPKDFGYKLVFGNMSSYRVRSATWKYLQITVSEKKATYKTTEGATRYTSLPRAVQLRFGMSGSSRDIPTNWQRLPEVYVEIKPPTAVDLNDAEKMKQTAQQMAGKLGKLLETEIGKIPVFAPFPDVDLATAKWLKAGNRLDFNAASAILYRDPKRFDKEFPVLLELDRSPELRGDLVLFVLRRDLGKHSSWVADKIKGISSSQKLAVATELRKRPHFGNYALAARMLARHDYTSRDIARSLGPQVSSNQAVRDAFIAAIKDRKHPHRGSIASSFLKNISTDKLPVYAQWLKDPDTKFAANVYLAMVSRDRRQKNKLLEHYYEESSDHVKYLMINGFRYDSKQTNPKLLSYVEKAAKQDKDKKLKLAAFVSLRISATDPAAWKLGAELLDSAPEQERRNLGYYLVNNAYRVQPEKAEKWLLDLLPKEYERLCKDPVRKNAVKPTTYRSSSGSRICTRGVDLLLAQPKDRSEVMKVLAKIVAADKNDMAMHRQIVSAIRQNMYRKQIRLDSPELLSILKATMRNVSSTTRGQVYGIMATAYKAHPEIYGDLLKKAREKETDTRNKQAIEKALR